MNANIVKSEIFIEKLKYESISDLIIKGLNNNSDENLIIDCALDRKWTKRQVLDSCQNFAYYLINDCKLCKGDVVCFVGHSSDIHVIGFLGVLLAGGVYTSLPTPSTEYEMKKLFQCLKPAVIICDLKHYDVIINGKTVYKNILLIEHAQTQRTVESIEAITMKQRPPHIALPIATGPTDKVVLILSSGSTGVPKVVIKTNANLLATLSVVRADANMKAIGHDVSMVGSSINHHGIDKILSAIDGSGTQIAIVRTFGFDILYENIHRYAITSLSFPPTLLEQFLRYCSTRGMDNVKSLCNIQVGGAPTPESTYEYILDNHTFEYFMNDYGMTETGHATSMYIKDRSNITSIGKPVPNTEIIIVDESDNALPANTRGEICIRSAQVTPGYLISTPEENGRLFTSDGFFRTGDIGYYDDRHVFYIVGRIKQLISVNGALIPPAELEDILLTHSDVTMAAVIGIPSDEFGEIPLAFVTLIEGATATVPELIEYVNSRVIEFKQLKGGLKVLDALPMTHADKVNKIRLQEMARSLRHMPVHDLRKVAIAETRAQALQYKAKDDDIFVVGFPKSGNNWMFNIVNHIVNDGKPIGDELAHVLEMAGARVLTKPAIGSHMPIQALPMNPSAKYIVILRNPKDVLVSAYHYAKRLAHPDATDDLGAFVNYWLSHPQHKYFEYVRDYWTHRSDENFLIVFYEQMKRNPNEVIVKIAEFLGKEFAEKLLANNESALNDVLKATSFEHVSNREDDHGHSTCRKGVVGDWRTQLNKYLSELIDAKFAEYFAGTELETIWSEDMKWR